MPEPGSTAAPLVLVVLDLQEGAGGPGEDDAPAGPTPLPRRLLLPLGYLLGVADVLLSIGRSAPRDAWPWPLAAHREEARAGAVP